MTSLDSASAFNFDHGEWTVGRLANPMPALSVTTTCAETYEWFDAHPDQVAAAIIDDSNHVVGIANRLRFLARYARRYIPELFAKRSILKLANTSPFVVDEAVTLVELGTMLTLDSPDALRESFVVTSGGHYLGIGTSEALVRSKIELLADREAQLRTALMSAHAASQTKSSFLALMSHELRTPLNAIIGFSEVLWSELFGPHSVPRYRDYAGDIHGAGKHLLELINDILDLSKLEAGKLELSSDLIDVADAFQDCYRFIAMRARERELEIKIRAAADLPLLLGDRLRVKQILLNLLSNAIKFTPPGGKVLASAELSPLGEISIVIADTGIGMAAEMIPVALEPFRQISSPFAREAEGTGLGLPLVKSLVELHGGRMSIESTLNNGTTVGIVFPAFRTAVRKAKASA